jgi:hypothetical protein
VNTRGEGVDGLKGIKDKNYGQGVESFAAKTLLVREGFPRIGWRAGEPVIIDQADGVIRIHSIHPAESADQRDRGQVLIIIRAREEARSSSSPAAVASGSAAYVEDALAAAAELLKGRAP